MQGNELSPASVGQQAPSVGVIICCYTDRRWNILLESIASVRSQLAPGDDLVVVVDHNPALQQRLMQQISGLHVLANVGEKGLSGARNTGIETLAQDVVLFLDDDAVARPGWLQGYRDGFALNETVVAIGGAIKPRWEVGRPRWFPAEFGWVVGCDYRGLPGDGAEIRNPIGASMGVRRTKALQVGGFSSRLGRVNDLPVGNEETELGIRLRQLDPTARIIRITHAVVDHLVPADRCRFRYYTRRCYHEGRSKAALSGAVGSQSALSAERSYVTRTLTRAVGRYLAEGLKGSGASLMQAAAVPVGLACTGAGYIVMTTQLRRGSATPLNELV